MRDIRTPFTSAEVAQRVLTLFGEPYSLKEYPQFVAIYNSAATRRVMRAGRQVSKTVTIAGDMVTQALVQPYTPIIYCNSSASQTATFSTSKLKPFLVQSPVIYHNLMEGKDVIDNVYKKAFKNYSEIAMSYFSESADRVRGTSGNHMYLDEVQDMLWDAMIDAEECLSAAPQPRFTYAGTSKSEITPLEYLWKHSTQNHWVLPCTHCGAYNSPSRENIGKKGLICKKCGGDLNTYEGFWYSMNPPEKDKPPYADGFWIPQIVMPMHCCHEEKWQRLLEKLETYPDVKFDNEVMGLPNGEGESPITEDMLRDACIANLSMYDTVNAQNASGTTGIAAGIDWGGGGVTGVSRTVLSIFAVRADPPSYTKIYGKIYGEGEPVRHVNDIARTLQRFHVNLCFGDHGGGNFAMSQLRGLVPPSCRCVPVMYTDSPQPYRWDEHAGRYTVGRTIMIDNFLLDLKQKKVRCFRWEDFEPFARDVLNLRQIYIGEEHGKGHRVWRHAPGKPDDSLHSMVFGWFAGRVLARELDFRI